jgi:hypothetical protein
MAVGCRPGTYVAATIGLGGARRKGFLGVHIMGSSYVGRTDWDWGACFLVVDDSAVNDLPAVEGLAVEGLAADEVVGLLVKLDINFRCTLVIRTYRTWLSVCVSALPLDYLAAIYHRKLCCSKTKFEECPSEMKTLSHREGADLSVSKAF